jgi:hypothetical protein
MSSEAELIEGAEDLAHGVSSQRSAVSAISEQF